MYHRLMSGPAGVTLRRIFRKLTNSPRFTRRTGKIWVQAKERCMQAVGNLDIPYDLTFWLGRPIWDSENAISYDLIFHIRLFHMSNSTVYGCEKNPRNMGGTTGGRTSSRAAEKILRHQGENQPEDERNGQDCVVFQDKHEPGLVLRMVHVGVTPAMAEFEAEHRNIDSSGGAQAKPADQAFQAVACRHLPNPSLNPLHYSGLVAGIKSADILFGPPNTTFRSWHRLEIHRRRLYIPTPQAERQENSGFEALGESTFSSKPLEVTQFTESLQRLFYMTFGSFEQAYAYAGAERRHILYMFIELL
ncbi:hypothetical protein B0H14DRAFT_2581641 [Mycena olivaceomarginata]|nr:hypothetical protein B0H14DRAFT_2581641 [Mycena olivaceomarginata]